MIRSLFLSAMAAMALCGIRTPAFAQTAEDREAVRVLVDNQYRYFGKRQAVQYGALFLPTATFITVEGMKMDGREEIVEAHAMFFELVDAGKNDVIYKSLTTHFVDPSTAITYSVWDGLWTRDPINGRAQSGYLTMVMHKVDGRWLIASATNAFNWRGTANYDLTEYDVFRAQMMKRGAPPRK